MNLSEKSLTTIKTVTLVIISSLTFALSQPNDLFPFGNAWTGSFTLIPLLLAFSLIKSYRTASLYGALFMGIVSIMTNYWLYFFQDFAFMTIGATTLGYMTQGMVLGWYILYSKKASPAGAPLLFSIIWTGFEFLKSTGFLGYPWGLSLYPFNQLSALNQIADITGIWSLSFMVAYGQAILTGLLENSRSIRVLYLKTHIPAFIILIGCILAYGTFRLYEKPDYSKKLDILLIQQNSDPWGTTGGFRQILTDTLTFTEEHIKKSDKQPDLICWSESSLSYPYLTYGSYYRKHPENKSFRDFLEESDSWFFTGTPIQLSKEPPAYMNGVILINPEDEVTGQYGKQHPVPVAEAIPFWEIDIVRSFFQNVIGLSMPWSLGTEDTIFRIQTESSDFSFGAPICFEDAFSDINRRLTRRGADFLLNLTNDSWSQTVSAQTQHLVVSKYRTIENRRPLIRSTNSGYTCIIDSRGLITEQIPMFSRESLRADLELPERGRITAYTLFGDWFALLCMLTVLMHLISYAKKKD